MALEITTLGPYNFTFGQSYISEQLLATGGYEPYVWELANGTVLPDGMTLNGATGYILGAAQTVQTLNVDIKVTDSNPDIPSIQTDTKTIVFSVVDAPYFVDQSEYYQTAYLGVSSEFSINIAGGVAPYTITSIVYELGDPPDVDTTAIVGSSLNVAVTFNAEAETDCWITIQDANGITTVTLIHMFAVDGAVGVGGKGVPHVSRLAQTRQLCSGSRTAVEFAPRIYGGVGPYVISNFSGFPSPPDNIYVEQRTPSIYVDTINGDWGIGFLDGSVPAGVYDITYDVTDANSNVVNLTSHYTVSKQVEISKNLLNIGEINQPYYYQLNANYIPSDINYPVIFQIDPTGVGLLPSGFSLVQNGDIFSIEGTTIFSNAFPITIRAVNSNYVSQCPDSWITTLYVGGVVALTHEVL